MPPIYIRWLRRALFIFAFILLLRAIGVFNYFYLTSYSKLQWPHLDAEKLRNEVHLQMSGMPAHITPFYNLSQFLPIISPKCAKMDSTNSSVLIVVRSAPDRNERRQAIRTTWGLNGPQFWGCHFRTIFIMGSQLEAQDFEEELTAENAKFGDLLVGQFIDHYNNATLKTQHALNFAAGHPSSPPSFCTTTNFSPEFAFLLDDDEFLVPWNLAQTLAKLNPSEHLYTGDAVNGVLPARTAFSKWQIAVEEYPFDHYPPYIQGNAVLMSRQTVKAFQLSMQYVKPVIWDDVYLGIISHSLEIAASCQPQIQRYWEGTYELTDLIAAHGFTAAQIREKYFELKDKLFGAM